MAANLLARRLLILDELVAVATGLGNGGPDKPLATAAAKELRKVVLLDGAGSEEEDEKGEAELDPPLPPPLIATILPVPCAKRLAVGSCCIPI